MAFEQSQIERPLRVEVAVEHRFGHPCRHGDLVEVGVGVTAVAEEPAGHLEDQLAALRARQPPLGLLLLLRHGHSFAKLPDSNLQEVNMTTAATTPSPSRTSADLPLGPGQWAAILGSIAILVWSVPGLIANPDFSIGDSATSVRVLGVDMNGWHAVSGFLVATPGFFAALRRSWSALFNLAAAGALLSTAVWAAASTQVAGGLFYFPHGGSDALLHLATSTIFLVGAAHYYLVGSRRTTEQPRT